MRAEATVPTTSKGAGMKQNGRPAGVGRGGQRKSRRVGLYKPIGGPQHCRVRAGTMSLGEEDHVNVKGAEPMEEANPFVSGIESTNVNRYY